MKSCQAIEMGPSYLVPLLAAVPSYTEATFITHDGKELKGVARDLPRSDGEPRRWTVEGWEWFINDETFTNVGIVQVKIDLPDTINVLNF